MRDHERIEELIAVRALGGLDGEDEQALVAEMATHGPACEDCRRLQAEYGEVAGRLAFSLDPEPVPAEMEDLVVGLATGSAARLTPGGSGERRARRRGPGGVRLRPLVAIAAAIVLFVGGLAIGTQVTGEGSREIPDDARVVAFQGEPGGGTLSVAFTPGRSGLYIVGADLPAPPEGQVYEVWMIEGDTPTPGPCLSPAADGSLVAFVDAEVETTDVMAVTVEPESCSTEPTTTPIFVADLATA
jgi:Anti-sigma-K factor rskA